MKCFVFLAFALMCLAGPSHHALAQGDTNAGGAAEAGVRQAVPIGRELRGEVAAAVDLLQARKWTEAGEVLPRTCARFEAKFQPGRRYVVLADDSQLGLVQQSSAVEVGVVDISYALCLQFHLFLLVEQKDLGSARAVIEKIDAHVPTVAGPHNEVGFVLQALGRHDESVLAYERAQSIALAYPPQPNALARSLRGIGANRIDQGRLDEAELSYRKSLEVEPQNQLAQQQLAYIRARRQR